MRNLFQNKNKGHTRISENVITVKQQHIEDNITYFQRLHPNQDIFPVLKSNAYGHGLNIAYTILKHHKTPYRVIDSMEERYPLRKSNSRFLLLGETLPSNYSHINHKRITPCVGSIPVLKSLIDNRKSRCIHLFLNTGMNREGLQQYELEDALHLLQKSNIHVEGVASHFSCADAVILDSVTDQIDIFKKMYYRIKEYGFEPIYRHIGNTVASLFLNDPFFTSYRVGLGIRGYADLVKGHMSEPNKQKLKPALSAYSHITAFQSIKAAQGVSYSKTWRANKNSRIATIPWGYFEGIPRSASNKIVFTSDKEKLKSFPQRGNICMNLSSFECDATASYGDKIFYIDKNIDAPNSVYAIAHAAQTLPYEILVRLSPTIYRKIV